MSSSTSSETALFTDRYELTMVAAALRGPVAQHMATFEVFTRKIPEGRRAGVVAGTARVLDAIRDFRFSDAVVAELIAIGLDDPALVEWMRAYRFTGDLFGYEEGELYGAFAPIFTVRARFADAVVLETVILSIFNHDCAVASAAWHLALAAGGVPMIEMGSRRTDPSAAVAAARAAVIGGFASTSNLAAGVTYNVPTAGTAAHSFVLAHSSEAAAFAAQLDALGPGTTLLVDTFNVESGIREGVNAARRFGVSGPGAIRIDSGDLALECKRARALLDELGANETRIVLSGDLDAAKVAQLVAANAPVDAFGVGTSVVTGDGAPSAGLAYKLVSIEDSAGAQRPVEKRSAGKRSHGGVKRVVRSLTEGGSAIDHLSAGELHALPLFSPAVAAAPVLNEDTSAYERSLQVRYCDRGVYSEMPTIASAQGCLRRAMAEAQDGTLPAVFDDPSE